MTEPHATYKRATRDFGDYSPIRLCRNYDTCGGTVGQDSHTDLCHDCAQQARRQADADRARNVRMRNHRIAEVGRLASAWWAATEPRLDVTRSLTAAWAWEVRRAKPKREAA